MPVMSAAAVEAASSGYPAAVLGALAVAFSSELLAFLATAAALAGLLAGHVLMRRRFERRLGGYTGDCLGAVQQCSEIGFLLGLLAWA